MFWIGLTIGILVGLIIGAIIAIYLFIGGGKWFGN